MTFMQAENVQEQGGGSDPIIIDDDTDTYYDISFKDNLSNINFENTFGTNQNDRYIALFVSDDILRSVVLDVSLNKNNEAEYSLSYGGFENYSYYMYINFEDKNNSWWKYDYENEELEVDSVSSANNVRILFNIDEIISYTGATLNDISDGGRYTVKAFTQNQLDTLFNITPAN